MAGGLLAVLAKSCILCGPLVKRLRHGPFTAVTWVRFPYGSPKHPALKGAGCFSLYPYGLGRRTGIEKLVRPSYVPAGSHSPVDCGKERGRFPYGSPKNSSSLGWGSFFVLPYEELLRRRPPPAADTGSRSRAAGRRSGGPPQGPPSDAGYPRPVQGGAKNFRRVTKNKHAP